MSGKPHVMVELHSGVVRSFTNYMEIKGKNPMVLFSTDTKGNSVKLGKVKRIFTAGDTNDNQA